MIMKLRKMALEDELGLDDDATIDRINTDVIGQMDNTGAVDTMQLAAEFAKYRKCIEDAVATHEAYCRAKTCLESIDPKKGMTRGEVRAFQTMILGVHAGQGFGASATKTYGLESFDACEDKSANLRLAKEGVVAFIGDMVKAIIKAIVRMGEWISDFVGSFFNSHTKTTSNLSSISKKLDTLERDYNQLSTQQKKAFDDGIAIADKVIGEAPTHAPIDQAVDTILADFDAAKHAGADGDTSVRNQTQALAMVDKACPSDISKKDFHHLVKKCIEFRRQFAITHFELLRYQGKEYGKDAEYIGHEFARLTAHVGAALDSLTKSDELNKSIGDLTDAISKVDQPDWVVSFGKYVEGVLGQMNKLGFDKPREMRHGVNGEIIAYTQTYLGNYQGVMSRPPEESDHAKLQFSAMSVKFLHEEGHIHQKAGLLPTIRLDIARSHLKLIEKFMEVVPVGQLENIEKAQEKLLECAKALQARVEHNPQEVHVGRVAVSLANTFESTYLLPVTQMLAYVTRVSNQYCHYLSLNLNKTGDILTIVDDF
jgi:hypothetical protein